MAIFPFPTAIGRNPLSSTGQILSAQRDRIFGQTSSRKREVESQFTEIRGGPPFVPRATPKESKEQKDLINRKPFIYGSPKVTTVARPTLTSMDEGFPDVTAQIIQFQFSPKILTENVSTNYAEANSMGRDHPILHWVRGAQQTITFEAICHSPSPFFRNHEELKAFVERIKDGIGRQPALGRPVVWGFTWGDMDFGPVVIESLGGIKYEDMQLGRVEEQDQRPASPVAFPGIPLSGYSPILGFSESRRPSGRTVKLPRQVTFEITLRKWAASPVDVSRPVGKKRETIYVTGRAGDSWEHVASKVYSKPSLGDALRQIYKTSPVPVEGVIYKLPDKEDVIGIVSAPSSIPLSRTFAGNSRFIELLEIRSATRYATRQLA